MVFSSSAGTRYTKRSPAGEPSGFRTVPRIGSARVRRNVKEWGVPSGENRAESSGR